MATRVVFMAQMAGPSISHDMLIYLASYASAVRGSWAGCVL